MCCSYNMYSVHVHVCTNRRLVQHLYVHILSCTVHREQCTKNRLPYTVYCNLVYELSIESTCIYIHCYSTLNLNAMLYLYVDLSLMSETTCDSSLLSEWIGCLGLSDHDKKCLDSNAWLSAGHISAGCKLLKIQFPVQNGLQDTSYLLNQSKWESHSDDFVQVLYVDPGHWACVSNIFCKDESSVDLFDSTHIAPTEDGSIIKQVAIILHPRQKFTIHLVNVSLQFGVNDCGVYALAMATDLVNRIDPTSVTYKQHLMRAHLKHCFEQLGMSRFPAQNRSKQLKRILCTFRIDTSDGTVKLSKGVCAACYWAIGSYLLYSYMYLHVHVH